MLCQLADITLLETSDGKGISHLLQGQEQAVRDIAVTEFAWSKSVRKGQYRLVTYPSIMLPEVDPWEMNNLYFDPNSADLVRAMERDSPGQATRCSDQELSLMVRIRRTSPY